MSQEQPDRYSRPLGVGQLLLRVMLIGGIVLAGIVGAVWYTNK